MLATKIRCGLTGLVDILKEPDVVILPIDLSLNRPLSGPFMPRNPSIARSIILPERGLVFHVLSLCNHAKVRTTTIKLIPVFMITFAPISLLQSKDLTMQQDDLRSIFAPCITSATLQAPTKMPEALKISPIHKRVCSN